MRSLRPPDLDDCGDGGCHGSKLAVNAWLWAAYLVAAHSNGNSAQQLMRQLGLNPIKTAWLLCAQLRRAMAEPESNSLAGIVEVDETTIPYPTGDDPVAGGSGRSGQANMLIRPETTGYAFRL